MQRELMAIGVGPHNGYANFVCVAARGGEPAIIDRRRLELIEPGLPNQPYHHETLEMDSARAEQLVKQVRESAARCAGEAIEQLRAGAGAGREIVAIAVREAVLPRYPESVAEVHASHWVMSRADSMIYHDALLKAAAKLGMAVEPVARGEERRGAAEALHTSAERLDAWLAGLRENLGPPWQKDHQEAAARAIAALGKHSALTLPGRRG